METSKKIKNFRKSYKNHNYKILTRRQADSPENLLIQKIYGISCCCVNYNRKFSICQKKKFSRRTDFFLPHLTTFPNDGEACFRNKNLCRNKM